MKNASETLKKQDIPNPNRLEVEFAIENLKYRKAPGVDHIPSELIQAGGDKLYEDT